MASLEVILKKDVTGVGEEGDIKNVKAGFARNFLFPRGFAVPKTKVNQIILEKERAAIEKRKEEKRQLSKDVVEKLQNVEVKFKSPAAENDKLFGSITNANISQALAEMGYDIDKRKIELEHHIKVLGTYDVKIKLYEGVHATIKVIVEKE